jgi:hypothetical protein
MKNLEAAFDTINANGRAEGDNRFFASCAGRTPEGVGDASLAQSPAFCCSVGMFSVVGFHLLVRPFSAKQCG